MAYPGIGCKKKACCWFSCLVYVLRGQIFIIKCEFADRAKFLELNNFNGFKFNETV